jgi:hypothetical protein
MKLQFVSLLAVINLTSLAQDHGHLNIGAAGTNQNDALTFDNAAIFETATNYVKTLVFTNGGRYANLYNGNITFTGLAATEAHAGPEAGAAALGAQLHAQLVSVAGPVGGVFAFWESGANSPTISLASGAPGTNTWLVSENDGSPGSDPYGHFHGRRFTVNKPGIYAVGFRAFDFSSNGAGGGPIHTPSQLIKIYFQAGVNIKSIEPGGNHTRITFAAPIGKTWVLETSDSPASGALWNTVGDPIPGDDYFHTVTNIAPVVGNRYYRAKGL